MPKIARSYVGRVGSLSNHRNVVFGQESSNSLRGMSWCVGMMQLPRFTDTLLVAKSSVNMLILTFSASSRTVTRRSCMTKVRTWSMSSSFRLVECLNGTSVALRRRSAIFESVLLLVNLCDAHGIVAGNPLELPNCFHLAIAKLLAEFNTIPLLESFRHFRRK